MLEKDSFSFGNPEEFEVNPLDINIAKMQFNLKNRCDIEVPEVGIFNVVEEIYESKDPTLDLSTIRIIYKNKLKDTNVKERYLVLVIHNSSKTVKKEKVLIKGSKNEINSYINSQKFFKDVKHNLLAESKK